MRPCLSQPSLRATTLRAGVAGHGDAGFEAVSDGAVGSAGGRHWAGAAGVLLALREDGATLADSAERACGAGHRRRKPRALHGAGRPLLDGPRIVVAGGEGAIAAGTSVIETARRVVAGFARGRRRGGTRSR